MYKRKKWIILVFITILCFSCEKKQATPPITYPNNAIIATVNATWMGSTSTYVYTPLSVNFSEGIISIKGIYADNTGGEVLGIYIHAKQVGTYPLSSYNYAFVEPWSNGSPNSFSFYTDSLYTGTVNLTEFDTINHLIDGTFSFAADMQQPIRDDGTATVTNGLLKNLT